MRIRLLVALASLTLLALAAPATGAANSRVTGDDTSGSYLRYDGQSDATMASCRR